MPKVLPNSCFLYYISHKLWLTTSSSFQTPPRNLVEKSFFPFFFLHKSSLAGHIRQENITIFQKWLMSHAPFNSCCWSFNRCVGETQVTELESGVIAQHLTRGRALKIPFIFRKNEGVNLEILCVS